MDSITTSERRSAHRRVGAATLLAFLALLLLGAVRGPAQADSTAPVPAATAAPTIQPTQPAPVDPDPGFRGDRDGRGPRGGDGGPFFGGGRDDDGGGGAPAPSAPAPSTGGSQT